MDTNLPKNFNPNTWLIVTSVWCADVINTDATTVQHEPIDKIFNINKSPCFVTVSGLKLTLQMGFLGEFTHPE